MKYSVTKILNKNIQLEWIYTLVILTLLSFILTHSELAPNSSIFSLLLFALFFSIYMLYKINIKRKIYSKLTHLFELSNDKQCNGSSQENPQYFELNKILDNLFEADKNEEAHSRDIAAKNSELRQIIDLVPHKIFAKDAQGKSIFVNKATAIGYGLTSWSFLKNDQEVINTNMTKLIAEEENPEFYGSIKIMQTTKMPFKTSSSDEVAMLGIAIDISKDKARQKELENNYEQLQKHSIKIDFLNVELEEFQHEIVHIMLSMLEIHDSYTKGHSENVANLSKRIAIELGLSEEEIKHAYWAGILHDIGKTVVPKEILNKDSKLTDEEFSLIQKHSSWGYTVLKNSKQLQKIADYVLYHHERWDSKGYPHGLKGQEIPLIAQILAIADCWDAMTSQRPYRLPLSEEHALNELIKNSGKQFNPEIVSVFLEMKAKENGKYLHVNVPLAQLN